MRTYPITIENEYALVPAARRGVRYWSRIDLEDWSLASLRSWTLNGWGYLQAKINGKTVYLHRLILGNPVGSIVDHIDRDPLNNRRSNLRLATKSENVQNQSLRSDNSTGYRGVGYHAPSGRYRARVGQRHLGLFDTAEAANAAAVAERERLRFRTNSG
ncbi:MAG: HNH endonuclease signature motif containing protein [Phycisphaerales bacterium JB047]